MRHEEFELPLHRKPLVEKWLVKANKKMSKFGPVSVEWGEEFSVQQVDSTGVVYQNYISGTLHFPDLSLGNYTVIGTAEVMEAGNLLNGSDEISLAIYQTKQLNCDHCGTNRRRKKFIIVKDQNGSLMSLGTACVQEYTGYDPKEALAALNLWASIREAMGDGGWDDDNAAIALSVVDIIAVTIAYTQRYSFVSSKAAKEDGSNPSHLTIQHIMVGKGEKPALTITEGDRAMAQKILEIWKAIPENCSEFDFKKRLMAHEKIVELKHLPLICGAANYDYKQMTATKIEKIQGFFGGCQSQTHTLTVTSAIVKQGNFADYILIKGVNESGYEWIYMGTSKFAQTVQPGVTYRVKCAVEHDDHPRWGKSNKLVKPKIA